MGATTIGVIGCGYWGPNLLRNFAENEAAELRWICDADDARVTAMGRRYPAAQTTTDYQKLLADPKLDAIAVVTPVAMHFPIAKQALLAGKHLLVEKPLTATAREAEELIELAERNRLFQPDINVLWDLAPHDLSIMDYLIERQPDIVSAIGSCHIEPGIENIAYLMMHFADDFIAHFHFNWLAPVKIRRTMIAGSSKMILYDDIEPTEKVRVYDKGVTTNRTGDREADYQRLVSYRTGDVWAPRIDSTEALRYVVAEFLDSIRAARRPLTDGAAGLRVVRLLEAAQESIKNGGRVQLLSSAAQSAPIA